MRLRAALLLFVVSGLTACTAWRIVRHNASGIDDHEIFPSRPLAASSRPFHFAKSAAYRLPERVPVDGVERPLLPLLEENDSVAFLVMKDDALVAEHYFGDRSAEAISLGFSMSKSFFSILIGTAIDDGLISSVEQPVTDYVPELAPAGFGRVTLEQLLQMTSGMAYVEDDDPFGIHPRFYYTDDLEGELLDLELDEPPGSRHVYKSGDSELLALVLTRALRGETVTAYMQRRLWQPLGMEHAGSFSVDRPGGLEKVWCCLAATARDFLKLGRLYLRGGDWNGQRIVSRAWVERSTRLQVARGSAFDYQFHWWRPWMHRRDFMASGHLGQYLLLVPEENAMVLRLGESRGDIPSSEWRELLAHVARNLVAVRAQPSAQGTTR